MGAVLGSAFLLAAAAGCGVAGQPEDAAPPAAAEGDAAGGSDQGSAEGEDGAVADGGDTADEADGQEGQEDPAASAGAPADAQNAQDCGPIFDDWRAVIGTGSVDCETAVAVLNAYVGSTDSPEDKHRMPRNEAEVLDGWACEPVVHAEDGEDASTYSMWCAKGEDSVLTTDGMVPVQEGEYVNPNDLRTQEDGHDPQIAFTSPTGKWQCGFVDNPPEGDLRDEVGCHGPIPEGNTAPAPDGGGEMQADTVSMDSEFAPELWVSGDVNYQAGPTLEYGQVVHSLGFTCTMAEDTGVTCVSPYHQFSVSSEAVELSS